MFLFQINAARQIISVFCDSVYGNSYKCKHVAALNAFVNNDKSESKTNHEQSWGKPSAKKQKLEKYAKGMLFSEMFPPQGDLEIEQSEVQLSELKNRSALKIMIFEGTKDEVEESVENLMNFILNKIDLGSKEEDCKVCVETFLDKCIAKNVYSKEPVILGELKDFYEKVIKLSRNQIVKLACDEWFNSRYLRVSASKNAYCIKSRVKKTVESLIGDMLFPKKLDIRATRYGREHESKAREMYESLFNVMNVGVVVSEKQPWLCASSME
ncbi:hypothetical protein JTB14_019401 [Gonioctena quinquepunctata]|nr:hypothetical protein JTB14_019401 [Gonioctena quinquepunctata]